jgi:hypothetical protein
MNESRPDMSGLGQSMALLLAVLKKEDVQPLIPFSGGFVRECLDEARTLLEHTGAAEKRDILSGIADRVLRRDLPPADIHESWFLDPLDAFPRQMITSILSLYPPRLMRYVARLVEEKRNLTLGKITLNDISPAAARQWASALLPPWPVRREPAEVSLLPALCNRARP